MYEVLIPQNLPYLISRRFFPAFRLRALNVLQRVGFDLGIEIVAQALGFKPMPAEL